jgi:hypothetical protein
MNEYEWKKLGIVSCELQGNEPKSSGLDSS